jgi:hypothetical protein
MRRPLTVLASAAVIVALTPATSISARADNGRIAAGVVGGLAVGTLLGAAAAAPRPYYAPAPVYVEPAPVYVEPRCYWTHGAPVWDDWRGVWYRPRMQVCD